MLLTFAGPSAAVPVEVSIGVLAKRGPERALAQWAPTAEYLTDTLADYRFRIVPLDFNEIFPAVRRGDVHFVLSNSAFYATLEVEQGASRVATLINRHHADQGRTHFGGVIFTRADRTDITTLSGFRGRTFMAVDSSSLGGYLAALREFRSRGIDPEQEFQLRFGGTHDAVVYAVLAGRVDGGTVRSDTLERMTQEGALRLDQIRILNSQEGQPFLLSTRLYPEWPLAALPGTDPKLVQQVAVALLQMPRECPAARAARCLGWTVPANYQPVHELLRELKLRPYEHLGRASLAELARQHWPLVTVTLLGLLIMAAYASYTARLNRRLSDREQQLRRSIQELELAHRQLLQTEKMAAIGRLAAGVAHEINNPVGYISSNLHMMARHLEHVTRFLERYLHTRSAPPADAAVELDQLSRSLDLPYLCSDMNDIVRESLEGTERVKKIVADLKNFARQDANEWEEADANAMIESSLNIAHNAIKYKAEVVREFGEIPNIRCIRGQLEQVFVNLLVNAAQAITEHGTITIRTETDGKQAFFEVEDTGCGIAEDDLKYLFDPFFTTKPVGSGTGLGLAISYNIIQRHGGEIRVDSSPGKGTRFHISLPLTPNGDPKTSKANVGSPVAD